MSISTYVTYNNKPVQMNIIDIFDPRFDTIKAITFSASRKFLLKTFFYFADIELILGIPNASIQQEIYNTLADLSDYHRSHKSMITETRKFYEASCRIPSKGIIHNKIYLLSNKDSVRTITGSANLSTAAFDTTSNQHENIIISDDPNVYQNYLAQYNKIRNSTMPYVDSETKKYLQRKGYYQC